MSELHEFIKKRTAKFSGISCRKLYGLDAFYISDKPFIIITSDEQVAVKVDDFQVKKILKIHQVTDWKLNDKAMDNWFLLPTKFNKKKNKLIPILEMTAKVLLKPKKEKIKRKKKEKTKKGTDNITTKKVVKKPSLFRRFLKKIKIGQILNKIT